MINFRTDLALERRDIFKKANNISNEVDGLETQEESFTDDIKISRVKVLNDNGEQAIGKRKGTYITIDIKNLKIKVEAGADHLISQLFFDNNVFYDFIEKVYSERQ